MKLADQARIESMLVMSKHKLTDAIMITAREGKFSLDLTYLECKPEHEPSMIKWLESEGFQVRTNTLTEQPPFYMEPTEIKHFYISW